ncbi:MAG: hypothetical protein ABSB35_09320 [Bryobacteraceae bacterium]|jgi:hypothetical protein
MVIGISGQIADTHDFYAGEEADGSGTVTSRAYLESGVGATDNVGLVTEFATPEPSATGFVGAGLLFLSILRRTLRGAGTSL